MKEINVYEKICKIGQGTFGEVFKVRLVLVITGPAQARDRMTNRVVALKKILMENEKEGVSVRIHTCGHLCLQFPITALREVKILLRIKHENITELIEVCASRGG
jgi:cyclin-dependent kinase 9